ncbi:hypothetical protein B0T14DRAFT_602738 [Immersiella caudata]|uniref:Uncharacterized protein n=1 Tax=Immersiella caudata TaxID=314043 RepID=A0AA39WZW1_9PEZI|nr:hypothetical protein B0T14DRAFT_602738 [Immersiella caudata]
MRVSTFLSTAIRLFTVAEAKVSDLTIPPVIRVGEDSVANFTYLSQQPRDVAIVWGVGPDVAKPGPRETWSLVMHLSNRKLRLRLVWPLQDLRNDRLLLFCVV